MTKPETRTITIRMGKADGPTLDVSARIFGALAVHEARDYDGSILPGWKVTHAPTGCAVWTVWTKRQAVLAASALKHLPWEEVERAGPFADEWPHKDEAFRIIEELRSKWDSA